MSITIFIFHLLHLYYSLFFSTSAGIILFIFPVRILLITKYISATPPSIPAYKNHWNFRFIPMAVFAIKYGYIASAETRVPKQQRSIEKKQRIKDAAIKLMSEKGYHSTSSNEIAKEADVSIGTFYSYFKDKKALYTELVSDIYSKVIEPIDFSSFPEDMSIEETVYLYISYVFKGHEYETAFQREIASLSEQSDEFREIEMAHKQFLTETFVHLLSEYKDQVKVKDLKTASYIILTIVEAVVHDNVFHNGGKKKKAVMQELTALIVNYLF